MVFGLALFFQEANRRVGHVPSGTRHPVRRHAIQGPCFEFRGVVHKFP